MRKYYYSRGVDRVGPVTLEELRLVRDLTPETLVWYHGLSDWVRADGLPELRGIFVDVPPPVPVVSCCSASAVSSAPSDIGKRKLFLHPFSFEGRIGRREYILSFIIICASMLTHRLLGTVLGLLFTDVDFNLFIALGIILDFTIGVVLFWLSIAQNCKRIHDVGLSGWYQLIPFYGIYLLFARGDGGSNRYGLDPKVESLN